MLTASPSNARKAVVQASQTARIASIRRPTVALAYCHLRLICTRSELTKCDSHQHRRVLGKSRQRAVSPATRAYA
jgi:hypothetical protein